MIGKRAGNGLLAAPRRTLLIVTLGLMVGAAAGFGAAQFNAPSERLTVPNLPDDNLLALLTLRGVEGDRGGSLQARREIVERCQKTADMTDCLRANYPLLLIDAENGSPGGMIAVAAALAGSANCLDLQRASFWLVRAQSLGTDTGKLSGFLAGKARQQGCMTI